ncbi:hypothetical protein [Streptomyces sp. R41]|uniref:Uncharacterized protein n=1 Tax=Streptomyces sp. R41 TaxID=3238632 RepID=A0AB39RRA1_9ACTN
MAKNNTQDTIKDFIGDIADSTKKAFDEILDRKGDDSNSVDWLNPVNPYQALSGLPGDVLRTVSALSALGGVANPVAALANAANAAAGVGAANPLAALTGAAPNPLAAITGGGANPLAALSGAAGAANPLAAGGANPLAALGQVAGGATSAVSGAADMAEGLAALPRQIAQLSELVASLVGVLENVQQVTGAVTGAGRAPAARKGG